MRVDRANAATHRPGIESRTGQFIKCVDRADQRRRLIARHLETWNEEKTKRWGPGEEGAAARADANDVLNMDLIAECEQYADEVIDSV